MLASNGLKLIHKELKELFLRYPAAQWQEIKLPLLFGHLCWCVFASTSVSVLLPKCIIIINKKKAKFTCRADILCFCDLNCRHLAAFNIGQICPESRWVRAKLCWKNKGCSGFFPGWLGGGSLLDLPDIPGRICNKPFWELWSVVWNTHNDLIQHKTKHLD